MRTSVGGIAAGMICGVLLVGAIAMANTAPAPAVPQLPLTAIELDSLSVYLGPSAPAPTLDQFAAFVPEPPPEPEFHPGGAAPRADEAQSPGARSVSAIVTGGARPLAIIDDATVGPGALLPDGARVVSIEKDTVVLREPDGTLRTLRLKAG